ncbi:cupin domain-containing protein [Pedobacter sp. 22226]|uniref:cupin domain-containing protein n=1 Tax=Pedobacter sp. 22226 TaxID=3453894 RepID=UPI003F8730DD
MDKEKLIQEAYLVAHKIEENGNFPNNPNLPLMIYKGTFRLHPDDTEDVIRKVFAQNGYTNSWVDSIFDYHHYHSNTHEVMGVFCGKADVQFGGDHGVCIELDKGDVIIIPAGVAHKKLNSTDDFTVVGAYPNGAEYNIKYGKPEERAAADEDIAKVKNPDSDPVYGSKGHLFECWYNQKCENV